jgi:hypothetical protein
LKDNLIEIEDTLHIFYRTENMDQPLFLIQEVPLDKQGQSTNKVTFLAHFSPTFAKQNPQVLQAKKNHNRISRGSRT